MADDNFELVEREYDNCVREEYPRQLKTRKKSYHSIFQRFNNFRIRRLESKLEKMKDSALTEQYIDAKPSMEIEQKSNAIARLEEKIMFLSKENIPENYVKRRAIKLKKNMISNLKANANNLYSIGIENKEAIFGDNPETIDVASDKLDRKEIEDSINAEFSSINEESNDNLNREEIESSINEEFNNLDSSKNDNINRQEIEDSINAEFSNLQNSDSIEEYTDNKLSSEEIKEVINDSLNKANPIPDVDMEQLINAEEALKEATNKLEYNKEKKNMDDIRVSRNNSSSAKMMRYDREGNDIREYNYVPMTDEEIREAQIKLGLDENGDFIKTPKDTTERKVGTATVVNKIPSIVIPNLSLDELLLPPKKNIKDVREVPVVITERDNNEVEETKEPEKTLDDYNSLKEKILYLKRQQELTRKQREEAQRTATETAERAREVREMFEESQKHYAQSIDLLKAYQEELEAECSRNLEGTEAAENDTRMNNDFISSHREKMNNNNRIISEIGSLIGDSPKTK